MQINIIGQWIGGCNGYSNHTKGLVNSLSEFTKDIRLECERPPTWEVEVNDKELKAFTNPWFEEGTTICVAMPQQWPLALIHPQKAFYGFVVWEGDKVPLFWKKHLNDPRVTGILVPSKHVKEAIENTFKPEKPIHVIPHGVDPSLFSLAPKGGADTPFTFIGAGGWAQGMNDRKGIQWLLKAFSEEFSKEEKVQLLLKINPAYCPPGWDLNNELKRLELPEDRPQILINTQNVQTHMLPSFYKGDCFVYPTMGEAFGLTCAEAMACGLPAIYTDFGGQADFCGPEFGWPLSYELQEVVHDLMYEGVSWAKPDLEALKKQLRYCFEHRDECEEKGKKASQHILENYAWKNTAEKLVKVIA